MAAAVKPAGREFKLVYYVLTPLHDILIFNISKTFALNNVFLYIISLEILFALNITVPPDFLTHIHHQGIALKLHNYQIRSYLVGYHWSYATPFPSLRT